MDGTSVKSRQKILRHLRVVDNVILMLKSPYKRPAGLRKARAKTVCVCVCLPALPSSPHASSPCLVRGSPGFDHVPGYNPNGIDLTDIKSHPRYFTIAQDCYKCLASVRVPRPRARQRALRP